MTYQDLKNKLTDGLYTGVTLSSEEIFALCLLLGSLPEDKEQEEIPSFFWKMGKDSVS